MVRDLVRAGPPDPQADGGVGPRTRGSAPRFVQSIAMAYLSGIGRFRLPTGFFTSFSDGVHHRGQGVNHRGNPHGRQNSLLADAFFAQHLLVRIDAHATAVDGRNRQAP